ncbi:MAG TPA: DUF308 domain-containing protein [Methylocella sp.]|nr:DUF308 domain-containing protein [Methylocella sp.]
MVWIFAGLTYIVVAAFAVAQPLVAEAFFTLVLGAGMIATGVTRIYLGVRLGASPRHPVLLAGVLTALVGVSIVAGWPANCFVILGVLPRPRSRVLGSGVDRVRVALAALLNWRSRSRPRNRQ